MSTTTEIVIPAPPHFDSLSEHSVLFYRRVVEVTGLGTSRDSFLQSFAYNLDGRSVVGFGSKNSNCGCTVSISSVDRAVTDGGVPTLSNVNFIFSSLDSSTEVEKAAFMNLVLGELKSAPDPYNPILSDFKEWLAEINEQ